MPPKHGLPIRTEVGIAPTVGSAERHAEVTDAADPATRERDEVENCGVASFPASDPPSWWSGA